jgi:hypothetical protein
VNAPHTPGPWKYFTPTYGKPTVRTADEKRSICQLSTSRPNRYTENPGRTREEAIADARLIAAAPDLLELARQYASESAECDGTGRWVENDRHGKPIEKTARPCEDCAGIRAVIAKAEGGADA